MPTITVDDVELHWREAGEGAPLVLLHPGPGLDGAVLWPWFEPLARQGRRVLALDLACSGRSAGGDPSTWTIERQAGLVDAWIDVLGLERPVVLGHSYGSFVALTLATIRPDRLAGVVASCGAASEDVFEELEERLEAFGDPDVIAAFEAEEHVATPEDCLAAWRGQLPFFVVGAVPELHGAFGEVVFQPATLREGAYDVYDLRPALPGLGDLPVLAVGGAQDRCTPPAATREIADLVPGGEAVVVDGAGHFAYAERPEAYLEALGDWLSRARPAQAQGPRGDLRGP